MLKDVAMTGKHTSLNFFAGNRWQNQKKGIRSNDQRRNSLTHVERSPFSSISGILDSCAQNFLSTAIHP